MKNELKDYLHLYLGCEIRYHSRLSNTWGAWIKMTYSDLELAINHIGFGEKIELALRPLSDMTEEELSDIIATKEHFNRGYSVEEFIVGWKAFGAETFRYLISKHFDLFGLIESGLAIVKPLTHTPHVS
jgi:hypothetical protein